MANVLTQIILDTRRSLKDSTFPVKLRLTYNRKQKYYPTAYSFTEEDYEKVILSKPKGAYKDAQFELKEIEKRARAIIKDMAVFTFDLFEKKFVDTSPKGDVFIAFSQHIAKLKREASITTAESYTSALNSLKAFTGKTVLPFVNVTPDYLSSYEQWMLSKNKSLTTVGIYLRYLRALFNEAIEAGDVEQRQYPFGKRKYQIPAGRNVKKALTIADIEKIVTYAPKSDSEAKARDLWLFSYLCSGINVKDIALLKYKNIDSATITFVRAKTAKSTRQNTKSIIVSLLPEAEHIIMRWGNKPVIPNWYVFPILSEGLTPEKELAKIKQATKSINTYMKRIASSLGIEKEVTTYTARHSYSTVLKRSGAPIEFISESLGHTDIRTTRSYLDSFEDDAKRGYVSALTAFPKKD
ncbi:tyrosine-type recombinase/integrase [Rufibacter latericius]|uniref:Site-specific integrase n=1 Tax=Rufibacter latericius TaxID=2487040 RepID=A0A3M9MVM8_9BACT|nr:site-specific integrase [Rufibacter latericius]RNI28828.1 site-specific integrase [Rufibacter latericius]